MANLIETDKWSIQSGPWMASYDDDSGTLNIKGPDIVEEGIAFNIADDDDVRSLLKLSDLIDLACDGTVLG